MRSRIALACLLCVSSNSYPVYAVPGDPGERVAARVDLYGDPLPAGAISRLGSVRLRGGDCVAFSPDGRVLAVGGERIRLWDVSTGRMLRELPKGANVLAFSPDGTKLATDGQHNPRNSGTVQLWDVSTGREIFKNQRAHVTDGSPHTVLGIVWSPDGRWFASISTGNQIHFWDVANGARIRSLTVSDDGRRAYGFALSPGGRVLAASRDSEIQLWDLKADQEPRVIQQAHPSTIAALAFTAEGRRLISAGYGSAGRRLIPTGEGSREPHTSRIRLWNPVNGEMTAELWNAERVPDGDGSEPVRNLVVSGDGKLAVSAHWDDSRAWTRPDGQVVQVSAPHAGQLRFWELPSGELTDVIRSRGIGGLWTGSQALALSPDRQLVAVASGSHVIRLWETATGRERFAAPGAHDESIQSVAWSPDGATIATASFAGTVSLWDPETGRLSHELIYSPDRTSLRALAFSPDGQVVAAGGIVPPVEGRSDWWSGAVKLWNVLSGELIREIRLSGRGSAVAFSPDGQWLAACSGLAGPGPIEDMNNEPTPPSVFIFDLQTGKTLFSVEGGGDHLTFTSDGKSLLFAPGKRWDFTEGQPPQAIAPVKFDRKRAKAISADGRWLGLAHWKRPQIELIDLSTGTTVWERPTSQRRRLGYDGLEFSDDGRLLIARGASEEREDVVLEVRTGNVVRRLPSTTSTLSAVGFSPDGIRVVSGYADGTALVWDLTRISGRIAREPSEVKEWQELWDALADADAGRAYDAVWALSALDAEAVAFLKRRLKPAAPPDTEHIRKRIARLNADDYDARRDATRELRTVARKVQKQLQEASDDATSPEMQKRLEALLSAARSPLISLPEEMRSLRAIEILERIGSPEARSVLQTLSRGAPGAIETEESKAALARWKRR